MKKIELTEEDRKRLKMKRVELGLSQLELSEKAHVGLVTVNVIETRSDYSPKEATLGKVKKALGLE